MIDPNAWGWPQWVTVIMSLLSLSFIAVQHGKPRDDNYNFAVSFMAQIISYFILVMGGFFK
jgi:hypothetical protein